MHLLRPYKFFLWVGITSHIISPKVSSCAINMAAFPCYTSIVLLWLLLLLCTTIMLNSVTCNTKIHCNKQDMSALLSFKQGVTDPSGLLSSWSPQNDCCQWRGIHCDNITRRVTELSLPCHPIPRAYGDVDKSHCLTGELDLSLLNLEFLSYLDLSYNDFKAIQFSYSSMFNTTCNDLSRGTPPHQCGNSSNLHYLDLSYNDDLVIDNLSWIPRLFSLQYLDLSGIDLHKETDWLQSVTMLPSLSELYLESCKLQNIYPSLQYANFTSLDVLDLGDNDFISELPNWIFNPSRGISVISLANNYIHGQLPKTLPNLLSIKSLILSENNLDGPIPDWLGQLKQLQNLDLSDNSFSGPIPASLGNLSALTRLDLMSNNLSGTFPTSLGKLHNLELFQVVDNFLTGNISNQNFHSLTNLKSLTLGSPALIFDFDHEWIPPFQLEDIWFEYVVPKLPSWLYTQSSLKALTILRSRVLVEPDKFWKFAAQLEFFSLGHNSVDADMSNVLLNSKVVWLNDNNLRGGVPQVSPNVTILKLSGNYLSGSISPLLCHKMKEQSNLEYLDISNNILSGEIPNCWTNWKSLLYVGLWDNNLTGKIPHSMGSLSNLMSLDLSNNKLSGEAPPTLQNCKNLWILNLAENMFSGAISSWMSLNLKALILRSNQFSGNISTRICQLHSIKILDFANNRLSGSIPNCLQSMTSMVSENASLDEFIIRFTVLNSPYQFGFNILLHIKGLKLYYRNSMYAMDLSCNSLSGTLPLELFMLTRLQSLTMSHNHLEGMIQEIGHLKWLESLDLSCNQLSGQIPQSMSSMSFLEVLNLSFNNFMGGIPSGTQLQGFTNLSYMGNPELCGSPLTNKCTQGGKVNNMNPMAEDKDDEESEVHSWFYMGLGIGFAIGFWGVLGVIFFNTRCRHAYFRFLGLLCNMVLLKMNIVYWSFRNCYSRN